jgi:hypothetical protein
VLRAVQAGAQANIVECGVFRGSGVYTWVKLLCLFKPNSEQRVVAFDFFETSRDIDKNIVNHHFDSDVCFLGDRQRSTLMLVVSLRGGRFGSRG